MGASKFHPVAPIWGEVHWLATAVFREELSNVTESWAAPGRRPPISGIALPREAAEDGALQAGSLLPSLLRGPW